MTQQIKEQLASAYNALATLIPIPSEEYSTKHAFVLRTIRETLQAEKEGEELEQ